MLIAERLLEFGHGHLPRRCECAPSDGNPRHRAADGDRGARAVLAAAKRKRRPAKTLSRLAQWALRVEARCGHNKATVALANKLARTLWAVWRYERAYDPDKGPALAPSV